MRLIDADRMLDQIDGWRAVISDRDIRYFLNRMSFLNLRCPVVEAIPMEWLREHYPQIAKEWEKENDI